MIFSPRNRANIVLSAVIAIQLSVRDHVKAVKIRIEAVLSLVAGDENQVVERHDATKDSDQQGSESL